MEKRMRGRSSSQQNVKDLIDIIRMVKCEKMGIYSITHDEVCEVNVRMDSSDKDYLFVLRMNTLFPSDYETKVKKIGFRLKNLKSAVQGKEWNENLELESSHYKVKNDEKFELYINIPKELEHMIDIIYVLDSVFPIDSIGSARGPPRSRHQCAGRGGFRSRPVQRDGRHGRATRSAQGQNCSLRRP